MRVQLKHPDGSYFLIYADAASRQRQLAEYILI